MTSANAAGPLFLEGPTGKTPVKYQNPNIVLNFDTDALVVTAPPTGTNAGSDQLVLDALKLWNDVTTNMGLSTINLTQGDDTNINGSIVDVDDTNYTAFIPAGNGAPIPTGDGQNPIIYDANGDIINLFFGGQSDLIGGFATSIFFVGGSAFIEGFAVINGSLLPGLDQTKTSLIVAHEIGHFIGLDHSLLDVEEDLTQDSNGVLLTACITKAPDQYPLMYPVVCRDTISLHQDDITSVATLYPSATINQQMGQITGNFIQNDTNGNTAILGANIWVQSTTPPNEVYSVVSDYLTNGTGFFSLYLPPGDYTLHANSINSTFNDSSSVGPYSTNATDVSFQPPLNPAISITYNNPMSSVIAGEATNVTFKLDGTGSSTGGGNIFTPPVSTPKKSKGGGGGGGTTSAWLLLALTLCLRVFRNRRAV